MLDPKRVRRQLLVPRLKGDALDWVERALSIGMGYDDRTVTRAFVETFPIYLEDVSIDEETALKILEDRFKKMRRDKKCSSYHHIKEHRKRLLELFKDPFIAMSLCQIIELEKLRQIPNLTVDQHLKTFKLAQKIEGALEDYFDGKSQYRSRKALSLAEAKNNAS